MDRCNLHFYPLSPPFMEPNLFDNPNMIVIISKFLSFHLDPPAFDKVLIFYYFNYYFFIYFYKKKIKNFSITVLNFHDCVMYHFHFTFLFSSFPNFFFITLMGCGMWGAWYNGVTGAWEASV